MSKEVIEIHEASIQDILFDCAERSTSEDILDRGSIMVKLDNCVRLLSEGYNGSDNFIDSIKEMDVE